jgi:transcriptional regulator with XRE-family HTH domain
MAAVDDRRVGLIIRALRRRLGWRQLDLARRARVRQQEVSDIERGHLDDVRPRTLRRVAGAVDARIWIDLQWRGGLVDRLLDQKHAALVEKTVAILVTMGWQVLPEASFDTGRAAGSIDLLAWHAASRTVIVIEVKTELTSIEATLRRLDVKVRVAPGLAERILGWKPSSISVLLVVAESTTARRVVGMHTATFKSRFPDAGRTVRPWLRNPSRPVSAVWFLPVDRGGPRRSGGSHRIRSSVPASASRP